MKNLFGLITLSTFLFFASCSKEALIEPQNAVSTNIEMISQIADDSNIKTPVETTTNVNGIDVTVGFHFSTPTVLNIDFTSSHDFTGSNIETTQTIDFLDGKGDTVSLTFGVNSYTGSNGILDVSLAIGGNDLSGLGIKTSQIVIEDMTME